MMKFISIIFCVCLLNSCGSQTYHTVKVNKPRNHQSWYKDHKWHKKIRVGRIRIRLFERQGVKPVRMKG